MWCKYRHKFASGAEAWEWMYLGEDHPHLGESPMEPIKEAWEEFIKEEQVPVWQQGYEWSDKYRGVEFEIVETAPYDVIEKHLKQCEAVIRANTNRANELRALLTWETSDDTGENDRGI
jgi:hypothetical protein